MTAPRPDDTAAARRTRLVLLVLAVDTVIAIGVAVWWSNRR
jgi:hypothetical protein